MKIAAATAGPFLTLLESSRLDRYKYICKIHGKKSMDAGRKAYMGAIWRRRLLFDLIGAPKPLKPPSTGSNTID